MAISEAFVGSATISTTEFYLASASTAVTWRTDDGAYQLWLDLSALAGGDEFEILAYERIGSAGTSRVVMSWTVAGAQSDPHFVAPTLILLHGWEFSVRRLAGADRVIAWSIRRIA